VYGSVGKHSSELSHNTDQTFVTGCQPDLGALEDRAVPSWEKYGKEKATDEARFLDGFKKFSHWSCSLCSSNYEVLDEYIL